MWLMLLSRYWKPLAALVLCVAALFWAYSKGRASEREAWQAKLMDERLKAAQLELRNGQLSDELTRQAASAQDVRQAAIDAALKAAKDRYADRPPVAAVCPSPDADLLRDMAGAEGRIGQARDRLRGLSGPDNANARNADHR